MRRCRTEGMHCAPQTPWEGIGIGLQLWLQDLIRPIEAAIQRAGHVKWHLNRGVHALVGHGIFPVQVDYIHFMQGLFQMGIHVHHDVSQARFGRLPPRSQRFFNMRMQLWEPDYSRDWETALVDLKHEGLYLAYPVQLDNFIREYPWAADGGRIVVLGAIDGPDADGWELAVVYEKRDGRRWVTTAEVGHDYCPQLGDRVLVYAR